MLMKFWRKNAILIIPLLIIGTAFAIGFFAGKSFAAGDDVCKCDKAQVVRTVERVATMVESPAVVETTKQVVTVTATAYCSCEKCCGVWAQNRPNGVVYTASGTVATPNRTIAVDPDVFPFGTVLEIGGVEYAAEDTGSAIKGNKIDIYFDDHTTALEFGVRELVATING